jgi:hypothetical protein
MRIQQLTSRAERRRLLLLWLFLVLVGAAVNVPLAISKTRSRTTPPPRTTLNLRGAEAAEKPWPSSTPHPDPWPELEYWVYSRSFGYRHFDARASGPDPEANGFTMDVVHLGWPLPVIEHKQMWWDWDNPSLAGPEPDPAPSLLARGLIGNPLLIGTLVFVPLVLMPYAMVMVRRAWRVRGGDCVRCGYTLDGLRTCPECGLDTTQSADQPSGTSRPRPD